MRKPYTIYVDMLAVDLIDLGLIRRAEDQMRGA
jgi:hypothetical protein